jgi:hypothetical protein
MRVLAIAIALVAACTRSVSAKESSTMSAAQTLTLSASVKGTQLHLVLTNGGTTELKVLSHVTAGARTDLDWYTVTVATGGAKRELRFMGDRDHSGRVVATLAAGATVAHDVDLDWWAKQPVNGGKPLPTGAGTLTVVYEVSGMAGVWNGRIESAPVDVRW